MVALEFSLGYGRVGALARFLVEFSLGYGGVEVLARFGGGSRIEGLVTVVVLVERAW